MNSIKFLKYTINLVGIYSAGVLISTGFVMISNDIFYDYALRKIFFSKNRKEIWDEIKPRELLNQGAKNTFLKHSIKEDRNDEINRYYDYIQKRKKLNENGIQDDSIYAKDIYNKTNK